MKMKKLLALGTSCTILLATLFFVTESAAKETKTITLRFSTNTPMGKPGDMLYVPKTILDDIEKRTKGRVKFQSYWMSSLANQREIVDILKAGTVDIAMIPPVNNQAKLPLTSIADSIPFEPKTIRKAVEAFMKLKDHPAIVAEWERWNMKIIGAWGTPPKEIASTKPLRNLSDIKGVKGRFASETNAKLWSAVGGIPINIPYSEVYQALDKGIIDATVANPTALLLFKLKEVSKYYQNIPFGAVANAFAINQDSLNKLPQDIRQIVMETFSELGPRVIQISEDLDRSQRKQLAEGGTQFVEFSAQGMEKWQNMPEAKEIIGEWIKDKESKGLPGKEILDTYLKLLAE